MKPALSTEELSAWVRLSLEPGIGPAYARRLLGAVGLPQAIYAQPAASLARLATEALARQLKSPPEDSTRKAIDDTLDWLGGPGHHLITLADPSYPPTLLDIHDPPLLLYVNGNPALLSKPIIAMVGARNASAGGLDNAQAFARYLAAQGWCIASGLAAGIDAAAHQGALQASPAGGGTVAVLGTGIDVVYPPQNRKLAHQIAEHGALVSEFPLGTRAIRYQFPKRNRIVAGLARGVLVVEAARQSGSLITARLATDMGREVFAIPGSIHSPLSRGCHALIRQGAKLVESGQDIHDELGAPLSGRDNGTTLPAATPATAPTPPSPRVEHNLDPAHATVLSALGYDPVHLDTLRQRTQLDLATLNSRLLSLELDEIVTRLDDGRFQRR